MLTTDTNVNMTSNIVDKTLIPQLGLCRVLSSCIETAIWTFNPLAPIDVNYMEKNPGMLSSKTFIFDLRKKDMNILDDIGQSSSMVGEDVLRGSLKRLDKGASLSALWSEMAKTAHEPNPPACCTPAKLGLTFDQIHF